MKYLFPILILINSCTITKNTQTASSLTGTWKPVSQIIGGNPLPEAMVAIQTMELTDTNYIVHAESDDFGKVVMNGNQLDIYGTEGPNAGSHFKAIYKLSGDTLTICYDLLGVNYPTDFISNSENYYFLSTNVG